MASNEVITIVFVFPRTLLQCALGPGFYWPPISIYHCPRFSPHSFAVCIRGRLLLASNTCLGSVLSESVFRRVMRRLLFTSDFYWPPPFVASVLICGLLLVAAIRSFLQLVHRARRLITTIANVARVALCSRRFTPLIASHCLLFVFFRAGACGSLLSSVFDPLPVCCDFFRSPISTRLQFICSHFCICRNGARFSHWFA